jgi:hypothetical protein
MLSTSTIFSMNMLRLPAQLFSIEKSMLRTNTIFSMNTICLVLLFSMNILYAQYYQLL